MIGNSGYAGNISLNISGAGVEIISEKGYAVRQEITKGEASQVSSVKISAGTIKGAEGALYFGNYDKDTYSVTGGTYSSDPSAYVESPYVVKQVEGKYVVALAGVAVTPTAAELVLGLTPTAKLTASSDIEEAFTWASKNNDVVTVDNSGNITAVGAGTADVTATGATSKSVGTCVVTVRAATPVSVTPSKMELNIGATDKATAKYDAKDSITWKSSDTAVATVKDGTVTAVKAGIAVITANGSKTSAACTVTVTDPAASDPVTPTPAPVDAGTVDKENNPVNKEEGKPENVEAATPAITEATEEGKAAVVSATKIEEKNLVATADGKLTISPVLAKSALEEVISADATVAPKNVVLLPIVKAAVTANNVAALAFTMTGEQLGAEENTVAGDVKVIKVLADGKGGQFSYASAAAGYADKTFTLKDADGKSLALTDKVAKASTYTLVIFVADNGDFDLDATAGSVIDPVAVATNAATEPKSGGSSSGCNGGFGALALFGFALVPMFYGKKR
ncbi:Ig-like domain-containing protein [Cloacibacillus evryensis]